jgi:hypothetical protein
MRLVSVLLLLTGAVVWAQEQPASGATLPGREKALDSAVRNLLRKGWKPSQPSVKPPNVISGKAACGYIRVFAASPDTDPGILIPPTQPDAQAEQEFGMPVYQGLPACDLPPNR